ncbi:helix-turn-helix domain-containing protein [Spirulina sp. 06S082]|uniref:helix-turn-helix domain-containing protein n=1 Tax=Spirulina sp. 06S082 TaxID=3110248 RepID=UPI002B215FF3|nr:helix-turn-helix domain-containing protein [Spirulina sp. 06S082]MEA5470573.1 helix-turn-helix domain-containing protein [Spirulina sp. 06S082]
MELQLATCSSGISPTVNSTTQLRTQSVFSQIEADLEQSEIYQRVMAGLDNLAGETLEATRSLLQSLGREAIRVTFQQIAQNYHIAPDTLKKKVVSVKAKGKPGDRHPQTSVEEYSTECVDPEMPSSPQETTETDSQAKIQAPAAASPTKSKSKSKGRSKFTQKITPAQRDRIVAEERVKVCRQIGHTLKEARVAQGISFGSLYSKTLIQVFYIKAIEEGEIDRLPEDVYLRGFIRRLGNSLGLDGNALVNSLPKPIQNSAVPSWYTPNINVRGPALASTTTLQAYVGYTALVAGAVGGLSWVTADRPDAKTTIEPEPSQIESLSQSARHGSDRVTISEQLNAEISPPEVSN